MKDRLEGSASMSESPRASSPAPASASSSWPDRLRRVPGLVGLVRRLRRWWRPATDPFAGSAAYWQQRYRDGGDSGAGSYGRFAQFKAEVLNGWFAEHGLHSAIEFGCGDGHQLALLQIDDYLGLDLSDEALARCRARFAGQPGRRFLSVDAYAGERAECALSLDVLYHLVEDEVWSAYLQRLFAAATHSVVIYSSNHDAPAQPDGAHVRHRRFSDWVERHAPEWTLWRHVPNAYPFQGDWKTGSFADFHCYGRRDAPRPGGGPA